MGDADVLTRLGTDAESEGRIARLLLCAEPPDLGAGGPSSDGTSIA